MISVIVPIYNVEKYLDQCVESVLKLHTELEVLLVDDGSTDGSGRLCDAWAEKDSRIRVIHQQNGGISEARNTGIREARGSHVLFLDSDDFLDPEETDRMLGKLKPDTNVLMGLYRCYYEEDQKYEQESCDGFLKLSGTVPVEQLLDAIPADGSSCFMVAVRFICRREFLLERELLFYPGIYHEDEEWTARLLCAVGEVTVTHCLFYQYRQARAGAITSGVKPKHVFDSLTILERMEQMVKNNPERAAYLHRRQGCLYLNCLLNLWVLRDEEKKQVTARLRALRKAGSHMSGRIGTPARISLRLVGVRATGGLLTLARKIVK